MNSMLIKSPTPTHPRSTDRKEPLKLAMLGAGSAFSVSVLETLDDPVFEGCAFWIMDIQASSLERAEGALRTRMKERDIRVHLSATTDLRAALDGADYVIVSCEQDRYRNWIQDIEIPAQHGVEQLTGENGGPGGQIHAMRNINMLMPIVAAMTELCPEAWLLNLTNPMSILCTYLSKYTPIKFAGFCHQVHGTVGVIAEQLGFEAGELEVISGGINHLNWLFDIRRRGTAKSCLPEFIEAMSTSAWWKPHQDAEVPEHAFSLEVFRTFGMYPLGYDNHICEYFSCFYEKEEWARFGITPLLESRLRPQVESRKTTLEAQHLMGGAGKQYPFPKNPQNPYYRESVSPVIVALETNRPLYLDAMVGRNDGAISNLPPNAVVDRPVVVVGGEVRSIHVGSLPPGPLEICRRQIALHDMVAQATVEGDERLAVQALCLDPYVRSITQARNIWADFRKHYASSLPSFG